MDGWSCIRQLDNAVCQELAFECFGMLDVDAILQAFPHLGCHGVTSLLLGFLALWQIS